MSKKRNSSVYSVIMILVLSILVITVFLLLFVNFGFLNKKSIHEDAKAYKTRHCLAFYPDSSDGLSMAKDICKGVKDDSIYDYTLIPYGDYYLINYGGDRSFFADKDYKKIEVNEISDEGKKIINDYVRYTFKKEQPDKYYNADFIKNISPDKLDFSTITYGIEGESLKVNIPQYEMELLIPLKYMQRPLKMNFGFTDELYRKPVYLDPDENHPLICITFDDGPYLWDYQDHTSTEKIISLLEEYDASATFYVVGNMLEDRELWADYQVYKLLKRSIGAGNDYGSHTQSHLAVLNSYSNAQDIYDEINGPIAYMRDFIGYEMTTYRPVEGVFNDAVLAAQPVPAVLWDVDSEDWLSRDVSSIIEKVMSVEYETGDIIIFHDIYNETAEALETLIPKLINQGCQLVSINDLFRYLNIDPSMISYFYSPNYYE